MSDPAKAVAVARDVLAQLDGPNPINVHTGAYLAGLDEYLTGDLRDHLPAIVHNCEVCAIGAAILSKARLYGQPADEVKEAKWGAGFFPRLLDDVFDRETTRLIEIAFELFWPDRDDDAGKAARAFGKRHYAPRNRLRAIMQNIVDHGGRFVPTAALDDPPQHTGATSTPGSQSPGGASGAGSSP